MRVKRLPVDTGRSGWLETVKEDKSYLRLGSEIKADYLVIGAGFAGLSAARRLSQLAPNATIVVLDAKRVGSGPAGRNSGFMIDLPHELSSEDYAGALDKDRLQIRLNRKAIEFASQAVDEYRMPSEVFLPVGKINGAATAEADQRNHDYAKHLRALGEPFDVLDRKKMSEITGSGFYSSGIYTPGTCLIHPALYVLGMCKGLANRVSIFEESPVVALNRINRSWVAATPEGSVQAEKVILATNGHIESFGHFKRRIFHIVLYASMTRDLSETEQELTGKTNWGITPSDPVATTMRKHTGSAGTRIITRNQMSYAPTMQIDKSRLDKMGKRHKLSFDKRYPELSHVEQEFVWAGRLCLSRNSAPAFGELEQGLYAACCQNGLGTTRGTLSGMAAAEYAAEGVTELVQTHLDAGQPSLLPLFPFDVIGANAVMGWKEYGARNEI